ncbi:hypothetical protein TVAG_128820 [Trichomonas vaginalis G3]|uniref:Uncharacterized protein n=1 Tax=Trichomonas vaginalis (strain ATCC PRA-98 / G3) TaxID=412133 RepID=A2E4D3_TRIV3|nr:hypothetical protein TVAGG3_0018590 [Trichomonas vaginalis G3]EAY12468.1 hypothetical protein TVAG_128820 [Trichomonas vaginalis G3]KAI5539531.1 hypothetical protein TVAGG3_0018590 [Trichomonas vaginalis G3]|eukprot:XP_001324691.1 hypothetical protein [Trichomonas vaginalis G3]
MAKKSEDVSSAVFLNKVDSFSISMTTICKRYLENAPNVDITTPEGEKQFQNFFENFDFKDDGFLRFITSVARFGSSFPTKSYEMFTESFPIITSSLNQMPKLADTNRIAFTERLHNVDWSNPTQKTLIFLLTQLVFSEYLGEMLPYLNSLANDKISYFIRETIQFATTDCITNSALVRKVIARSRIKIMYYITKLSPEYCFDKISAFLSNASMEIKPIYYLMFSSAPIGLVFKPVYMETLVPTLEVIQKATDRFLIYTASKYYMNVVLQILVQNPSMSTSSAFTHIYDDVKKLITVPNQNNELECLFAALTNFIFVDKCRSAETFFQIHVKQCQSSNPAIMRTDKTFIDSLCMKMAVKLKGANYEPPVLLEETHHDLKWSCDVGSTDQFYQDISIWLKQNIFELNNNIDAHAELLKMLYAVNHKAFLEKILPILNRNEYINSIATGLCKSVIYVLSNRPDIHFVDIGEYQVQVHDIIMKKLKMSSQADQNVSFDMNSLTEALQASINDKPIALQKIIETLRETSFPFPLTKRTTKVDNQIAKELQAFDQRSHKSFKTDNVSEIEFPKSLYDRRRIDEELAIHAALYVDLQSDLVTLICHRLFSESVYTTVLTIRALQAAIHLNKRLSETIFNMFAKMFLKTKLTFTSMVTIIVAMINLIETAKYEEATYSQYCINSINFIIGMGLCVPHPQLRERLFKVAKVLNQTKTINLSIVEFILNNEEEISSRAISNALSFTSALSNINKSMLPKINFRSVLESNYSSLYLFYLSSLGFHLSKGSFANEHEDIVVNLMEFLMGMFCRQSKNQEDFMFIYNSSSLLFAISDVYGKKSDVIQYFAKHRIQSYWSKMIEKFKESDLILLAGIISNMSLKIFPVFATILSKRNINFQYIICSIIRLICKRKDNNILDENGDVTFIYYNSLYNILLTLIKGKVVPQTLEFKENSNKSNTVIVGLLTFFGDCLKEVFTKITQYHKVNISITFTGENLTYLFCNNSIGHSFDTEIWFTFFCNITSNVEAPYLNSLTEAFSLWMRISKIPTDLLQIFSKKILNDLKYSFIIYNACFAQHPEITILEFMEKSRSSFPIFMAISDQLHFPNNLLFYLPKIEKETDLIEIIKNSNHCSLYYQYCGRLMALCFMYLASNSLNERIYAFNFLEKLVFISMMYRNDVISCVSTLKVFQSIKNTLVSSFSVFIQKEIFNLSSELAKTFGFLSEQFAQEIFYIVKFMKKKRNKMTNNTVPAKRRPTSLKRRVTTIAKMETIDVNTPEILTTLMPEWLTPISFDLQKSGISSRCEKNFKCYTLYLFLQELLSLVTVIGMIQPISVIMGEIIERDLSFLIYVLLNIQVNAEDNQLKASSDLVLIYIFSKMPEKFYSIIVQYLDISTWYFYNVLNGGQPEEKEGLIFAEQENIYNVLAEIVLNVILHCYNENPEAASPLIEHIILFCSILFAECREENLEENEYPTIIKVLKKFGVWVDSKSLPNFKMLVLKSISSHDILMWGLCCGHIVMSGTALQIFFDLGYSIDSTHVNLILRAMQAVSSNLSERSDSQNNSRFNKYISVLHFESKRINLKPAIQYLTVALNILERYIIDKSELPRSIFNAAIQFMRNTNMSYRPIYVISLSIVSRYISNDQFLSELSQDSQLDILNLLFSAPREDKYANVHDNPFAQILNCMRTIIYTCIEKKMIFVLTKDRDAPVKALFALYPFMWGRLNNIHSIHNIAEYYAKIYGSDARILVTNAISGQSRSSKNAEAFWNRFKEYLQPESINDLLKFYTLIAFNGDSDQKDAVFWMTNFMANSFKESNSKEIAAIAYAAIDVGAINSDAVLSLLHTLVKNFSTAEDIKQTVKIQKFTDVDIYPSQEIFRWKPQADDVFRDMNNIPPLYVCDNIYLGSEFSEKEKVAIQRISCTRLLRLADSLSRAILQGKSSTNFCDELVADPESFINKLIGIINETKNNENEKVTRIVQGVPCLVANNEVFTPTEEEVDSMCKDAIEDAISTISEL